MTTLRVGTRASALALAQSGQIARAVAAHLPGADMELVHVATHGDVDRESPLAQIGGTGVFVAAVRRALLNGEVDAIVHSAKDLPTAPAAGLAIACIPARQDVRDALCARDGLTLAALPEGASVGTGSPRRAAQLLRRRPDLRVVAIRGNVDTRLARAQGPDADLDAVVLAASGLRRLGKEGVITELLDPDVMLPAPAQGALAVEIRTGDLDGELGAAMRAEDDPSTRAAVIAERTLLRALEAGCSAPVGALGTLEAGTLRLRALAVSPDGTRVIDGDMTSALDAEALGMTVHDESTAGMSEGRETLEEIAAALGERLAADLLSRGAGDLLSAAAVEVRTGSASPSAASPAAAASAVPVAPRSEPAQES